MGIVGEREGPQFRGAAGRRGRSFALSFPIRHDCGPTLSLRFRIPARFGGIHKRRDETMNYLKRLVVMHATNVSSSVADAIVGSMEQSGVNENSVTLRV